jgi:rSAM/selenodomain-associated transferase 2
MRDEVRTGVDPDRVSVVIPTWEEESAIGRCLASVLENPGPLEVIVVDGGSRDRTVAIAGAFRGIRVLREAPRGRGSQMNAGARVARGGTLWFVHADSRVPATGTRAIREALARPGVAGGAFRFAVDSPRRHFRALEFLVRIRSERWGVPYGDQGLFLRADTFEQAGGFSEVPILEDLYLVRRLRRLGEIRVVRDPILTSPRRWQDHGLLRTTIRNLGVLALDRLGARPERMARLRRHAR